jgi:fused signal recognition particle receptor
MSERKPGFFKRLFSFGQAAPGETARVEETPVLPTPTPEPDRAQKIPEIVQAEHAQPVEPIRSPEPTKAKATDESPKKLARKPGGTVLIGGQQKTAAEKPEDRPARTGWFGRMAKGLSRSSAALTEGVASVFTKRKLDDDTLQDLEDLLIRSDLGTATAMRIGETLTARRYGKEVTEAEVREVMAGEIEKVLAPVAKALELDLEHKPHVILVVGVNGSGKTTTIGKLSAKLRQAGLSTLLVAGDTFRAAAIEQLKIWGDRTGAQVLARETGADAAGLAFDAWNEARASGHDVMLMDTAGRLQNRTELMAELEKIIRVLRKQDPSAPHTVLLTLDATTGQNALNQVDIFSKVAGVTGLVMTKLDGTARGGILVAISEKFKLPVYFIGVGETVEDLQPFEAADFARSIAGLAGKESIQ